MKKLFYRELNANYFLDTNKVTVPHQHELIELLIEKLEQKVDMVQVIYDKRSRNKYLKSKKKSIPKGTPELKIRQKIGERVAIDFLQLIVDLSKATQESFGSAPQEVEELTLKQIYQKQKQTVKAFKDNRDYKLSLKNVWDINLSLIKALDLSLDELEQKRVIIEDKEGSFYKGKIVEIEE